MDTLDISSFDNLEDDEDSNAISTLHISEELPIFKYKEEIIKLVSENQVVIIQGQTGCGKTTQIPQYLFDAKLNKKSCIGITQPRKIAAISMAKRVAKERESGLGKEVGYEIRFDKKVSGSTMIKYMTDGILLIECATNKYLNDYGIIMIDEAHERSVNSDVLIGLLKRITTKREDLKIIIASATISVEKFSKYFNDAKIITIEGSLHPIEIIYTNFSTNYVNKAIQIVDQINNGHDQGDILIFLTGEEEIEECCDLMQGMENLDVKPLYSAIDFDAQQSVFLPPLSGHRKVVVATNIAETSITITGVRFVIDCGYVKQSNFVSRRGIDTLESVKISKAQANQRKGRAGRNDTGWCYRLYTESMYDRFEDEALPEIHRKNLAGIFLKLVALKIKPKEFEFLDRPTSEELERSEQELKDLSLIKKNGELAPIGEQMIDLPVEPCLGKVLITSLSNACSPYILKIISLMSEKNIFHRPKRFRDKADLKIKKFHDPDGDQFTFLNVYNEWLNNFTSRNAVSDNNKNEITNIKTEYYNAKKWCYSNFINFNSMITVDKVLKQIQRMFTKNHKIDGHTNQRLAIKKSIIAGYFKNICVKQSRDAYIRLYGRETLFIHPNSTMFNVSPKIILFHEVRKTTRPYMHGVMRLEDSLLKDFKKELEIIDYPDDLETLSEF